MSLYVYPTDIDWFRFLRDRSPLDEVNFWQPGGGSTFTRLQAGDLFFFRLKSPINRIGGFGVFAYSNVYPLNIVWEAFLEKNGVASYQEFCAAIFKYRRKMQLDTRDDSSIGCIILHAPFFLDSSDWIEVPADYSLNLVQGKRYGDGDATSQHLLAWATDMMRRYVGSAVTDAPIIQPVAVEGPVYGEPVLAKRRLGQGTFRLMISDTYQRRCAITGEKTFPILEAAHIKPVSRGGENRIDNGLLLRSDLHTLFDLGYLTITPPGKLRVSPKLRETWMNGKVYYDLEGSSVRLPAQDALRPSLEVLEWHNDTIFRA